MTGQATHSVAGRSQAVQTLLLTAAVIVAAGTFVFDLSVELGIAGGVPYILAVLLCTGLRWRGAVLLCAAAASVLIMLGYVLSPPAADAGISAWTIAVNRSLALFVVWTTATLGYLHRRATDRAVANHRFLSAVLDTSDALVVVIERDGRIVRFNRASERLTGHSSASLLGSSIWPLIPPEDRDAMERTLVDAWTRAAPFRHETHWLTPGGERRLIAWIGSPLRDGGKDAVRCMVCTGTDVSEERRATERVQDMQRELYRIARVSELGEMASAIAHELVQPLAAISNYLRAGLRLQCDGAANGKIEALMREALEQAERGGQIIQRLRKLMARGESELLCADLNAAVRDACRLALIGTRDVDIDVRMELSGDVPQVSADPTQIQQVVINLVRNAVDALRDMPQRALSVHSACTADGGAEVRIMDSGCGLDAGIADRLFMPFMTTKADGVGIGLSISRSIIQAHGGRIWAEPRPGGGTVFVFTLPPSPAEVRESAGV